MFDQRLPEEPHLHQIEPTNHCPYTCVMCPRHGKMTRELGFMELDLYRKVIDEVAGYSKETREKEIELFHFGESLLHPDLVEMIQHASAQELRICLSVNAPHLKPELSERILEASPYRIIISLDGYDAESYRRIRGKVADFDLGVRHIQELAERHAAASSDTLLTVRMIELEENRGHGDDLRAILEPLNLTLDCREFFPWAEPEMADLGDFDAYPARMPCPFPWEYLVVQWNGSVVPCCRDYDGENALGHVRDQTLREIWHGDAHRAFRDQHRRQKFEGNDICRRCMSLYFTDGSTDNATRGLT